MSNEMTAEELKRLSALRILNEAFKDQPRVNHLEDTQVPLVIDAMLNHSKEAVKEFAEEELSFARSQAIEFAEWMYIYNTHYEYFKMYNGWKHKNTGHQDDVYIETSTFYSMFLAHQAKQKEGGKI